jgi:pentose-5-phosphate-3-epimerase
MKISSSIYSYKGEIKNIVNKLDSYGCDYFHIDCNDDVSVFNFIEKIRKISKTPIDLHIISSNPEKFYDLIEKYKIELVSFQVELLPDNFEIPKLNSKVGLAIKSKTPISILEKFKKFKYIMLITTPSVGKSGGEFDIQDIDLIKSFKDKYQSKALHIDGGINENVINLIKDKNLIKNINCCVSGNYLVSSEKIFDSFFKLKSIFNKEAHLVSDYMVNINQIPLLEYQEVTLNSVLKKITDYKMGFVIIINEEYNILGIITDGDFRREVILNLNDLNDIDIINCINKNPITLSHNMTIIESIEKLNSLDKKISFFPIMDNKKMVGLISIRQLFSGEYS